MKNCLKILLCGLFVMINTFLGISADAEEYVFSAQKATARAIKAGDTAECIIEVEDENLYSYRSQLVYDADIFEVDETELMYIKGEYEPIKYFGKVPVNAMNTENCFVYKHNGATTGFFAYEQKEGIYRNISTRMGFEQRTEGDAVLKIRLKAKRAGESFVYLMDEQSATMSEDGQVEYRKVKTSLTVTSGKKIATGTEITDERDIAYPWRENTVELPEKIESIPEGMFFDVSYANAYIDVEVKNDGKIICKIPYEQDKGYPPVLARVSPTETAVYIKKLRYDAEEQKIIFELEEFGEYCVIDNRYDLTDCEYNSEIYNAVCYLKSIGALDEKSLVFNPKQNITKAELVKILVCCIGGVDYKAMCWFDDVKLSDWYYQYVATALQNGIISDADNFYPDSKVGVEEAKDMLRKTSKIINGSEDIKIDISQQMTREKAAVAVRDMLCFNLR